MGYLPFGRKRIDRGKVKAWGMALGRFSLTVICSSALTILVLHTWSNTRARKQEAVKRAEERAAAIPKPKPPQESAISKMEGLYKGNLEEIFQTLRSRPNVRMVKLVVPSRLLSLQRAIASVRDGASFQLRAKQDQIPVMAVSSEAKRLLDQMLVVYINPRLIQKKDLKTIALPFPPNQLREYLLVPDVTGENAFLFSLERR